MSEWSKQYKGAIVCRQR